MKKAAPSKSKKAVPPPPQKEAPAPAKTKVAAAPATAQKGSAAPPAGKTKAAPVQSTSQNKPVLPSIPNEPKKKTKERQPEPDETEKELQKLQEKVQRPSSATSLNDKEVLPAIKGKKKKKGKTDDTQKVASNTDIPKPPPLPPVADSANQQEQSLGRAAAPPPAPRPPPSHPAPVRPSGPVPVPPPLPPTNSKVVNFELQSWGFEDPQRRGYIKIQGRMVVDISDSSDDSSRGLHIVTVQEDPTKWVHQKFDLWAGEEEARACSVYLGSLPKGTIIAGASADEISKNLSHCKHILTALGLRPNEITYRGSITFVAKRGDPSFAVQMASPRHEGPTKLNHPVIMGPGINAGGAQSGSGAIKVMRFDLKSWGYDDSVRKGHIKLNDHLVVDLENPGGEKQDVLGLHIVTLKNDPKVTEVDYIHKCFNLWQEGSESEARACTMFLRSITDGTYVAGASAAGIGKNLDGIKDALYSLGIKPDKIGHRSSLVFIAKAGDPSYAVKKIGARLKGPVMLSHPIILGGETEKGTTGSDEDSIRLPTADELLRGKAKLKSHGGNKKKEFFFREKLFDQFNVKSYYPLEKLKDLFTVTTDNAMLSRLDFSGVDQLTDLVFLMIRVLYKNSLFCRGLSGICLQGCHNITDQGIRWMTETFQQLEEVKVSGCHKLTEKSLHHLMTTNPRLQTISIRATDVGVVYVPEDFDAASVRLQGCPLVSPPPRFLEESSMMTSGAYFKNFESTTTEIKHYKAVVMATENVQCSLTDFLSSGGSTKRSLLNVNSDLAVGDGVTYSVIECEEEVAELFISERTLYIIPYPAAKDRGFNVKTVVSRIFYVLTRIPTAVFLLVGVTEGGKVKTSHEDLKKDLEKEIKKTRQSLGESCSQINDQILRLQIPLTFSSQLQCTKAYSLLESMDTLLDNISYIQQPIDVNKASDADIVKTHLAVSSQTELAKLHPMYQRLSVEFNQVAATAAATRHISSPDGDLHVFEEEKFLGILREKNSEKMGTAIAPYRKCLQLLHVMGKLVYIENEYKGFVISDLEWLAKVMTQLKQGSEVMEYVSFPCVHRQTPVLTKEQLSKGILLKAEVPAFIEILKLRNLVLEHGESLVLTSCLQPQPPVTEEHFIPGLRNDDPIRRLHYLYTFSHQLPKALISHLVALVTKIATPVVAWQQGVIIQDMPVTVRVKQISESTLSLDVQTMSVVRGGDPAGKSPPVPPQYMASIQKQLDNYLWCTAELYHGIICSVVTQHFGCYHETQISLDGEKCVKPAGISVALCGHRMAFRSAEQDGEESKVKDSDGDLQLTCVNCGKSSQLVEILWKNRSQLEPTLSLEGQVKSNKKGLQQKGTWFSTKPGTTEVTVPIALSPRDFSQFQVTMLGGDNIQIGFMKSGQPSSNTPADTSSRECIAVIYDSLNHKATESFVSADGKDTDVSHQVAADYVLRLGDTVRVECLRALNDEEHFIANFYKNGEKFYSAEGFKSGRYFPVITAKEQVTFTLDYSLSPKTGTRGQTWEVGMRLEARDRLTPGYVCVANIVEVNSEEDSIHLNFDGWTSRYNYWTTTDNEDLHPIGYMEQMKKYHPKWVQRLQPPKTHKGPFDYNEYLASLGVFPVPYHLFSETQTEGCDEFVLDAAVTDSIMQSVLEGGTMSATPGGIVHLCAASKHQPARLQKSMADALPGGDVWNPSKELSFCLLPSQLDTTTLEYPSLATIFDRPSLTFHYMCSNKEGWAHLMDIPGRPFTLDVATLRHLAQPLLTAACKMMHRPSFLPKDLKTLVASGTALEHSKIETGVRKLLEYLTCMLYIVNGNSATRRDPKSEMNEGEHPSTVTTLKQLHKFYDATVIEKDPLLSQHLVPVGPDTNFPHVMCKVHQMAAVSKTAEDEPEKFNMDEFSQYCHMVCLLDLSHRNIPVLPAQFFKHFPHLTFLSLNGVGLESFPEGLEAIPALTTLNLGGNKLCQLPADFSACANTLQHLTLSDNPLYEIPAVVYQCTQLTLLAVANIGLTTLSDSIGDLDRLEGLNLGNHSLSTLPGTLSKLSRIETLDASGVAWIEGQDNQKTILSKAAFTAYCDKSMLMAKLSAKERGTLFDSCDEAEQGILDFKGLQKLNAEIFKMFSRFSIKSPGHEEHGGCPPVIFQLPRLRTLNLSFHGIEKVTPHFGELKDLREIHFSHNPQLQSVASEIGSLTSLEELSLRGCPSLKTPPKEIVSRGFQAVYGYLHRLQMGSVECWRTKLMMVGLGGAGKTSLVTCLTDSMPGYHQGEMGQQITDGIDIKEWNLDMDDGKSLQFSVWDFAGQTVYYNTHQFFLSNRAVYLLLWNMRLGYEHAGLDFWLSSIACHAPKASILVVGTHRDQVSKFWLPEEELKRRYRQIRGFHAISCYTGDGIYELQEHLKKVAKEEKYMGEKIPEAWLKFESRMLASKKVVETSDGPEKGTTNILAWEKIVQMAIECGIYEKMEILQSVQFLHELGSVQHFANDFLKSKVVINPQWIVDAMACVVSVQNTPIVEGRLFHKHLTKIWKNYDKELLPWLIRLTEEFDLTFPLPEENANLVPCLLPANEPQYSWPDVSEQVDQRENKMVYMFEYLPAGLFNRAQVRLYQYSDSSVIWKKGSLLKKNGHLALLLQKKDCEVLVKVQGSRPENILFMIHEVFEGLISESFHGVTYDYLVPCADCLKVGTHDPCMFPASKVRRATELKAPFLQCDKYFHTLSLNELHAIMPPDNSTDFDVHLERSLRDLRNLRDNLACDVFMVYSAADIPQIGEEDRKIHPRKVFEDLQSAGHKVWFTSDPAMIRPDQVTVTLRDAKLVIICISNGFVADKQCCEIFHYIRNMQKDIQLVVLGDGHQWQKSDLGLQVASEVFVNMINSERYLEKSKELEAIVQSKLSGLSVEASKHPSVFISYCWANSQEAVSKGSRPQPGSLGWGDPRHFKKHIEKSNIACWMDIERVGQGGLFEDIAKGLKKAKVMVACVSDEYAKSRNCQMEFRFASVVLSIPIVLAPVGTGHAWETSEVGMLALGWPKINCQFESPTALERLLEAVKQHLPDQTEEEEAAALEQRNSPSPTVDNNQLAYKELLELAQRKFLRQISNYANAMNLATFPRLLLCDFLTDEEKKILKEREECKAQELKEQQLKEAECQNKSEEADARDDEDKENCPENKADCVNEEELRMNGYERPSTANMRPVTSQGRPTTGYRRPTSGNRRPPSCNYRRPTSGYRRPTTASKKVSSMQGSAALSDVLAEDANNVNLADSEYCIRMLCEQEGEWHTVEGCCLPLPPISATQFQDLLKEQAPYMARLLAILKHSSLALPILTTERGEVLQRMLEEACGSESEYREQYQELRKLAVTRDHEQEMGQLARCHLPSGKVKWLCKEHQQQDRITVLTEEVADIAQMEQTDEDNLMAEQINQSQLLDHSSQSDGKAAGQSARKDSDGASTKSATKSRPGLSQRDSHSKLTDTVKARGKMLGAQAAARVAGGYATKSQACSVM